MKKKDITKSQSPENVYNKERRSFLRHSATSIIGFGGCMASPAIFSLSLSGCSEDLSTSNHPLPSDKSLSDGLGFYTLIRKKSASTPLFVTLDLNTSPAAIKELYGDSSSSSLNSNEIMDAIKQLGEMKVLHLTFIANAPFSNPNMVEYIKLADSLGISCSATTRGSDIDEITINQLSKISNFSLIYGLDGASASTHDAEHGSGDYIATTNALKLSNKAGIHTTIVTHASQRNFDEINSIINQARSLGASAFHLRRRIPINQSQKSNPGLITSHQARKLLEIQENQINQSLSGTQLIGVDPFGGSHELFVKSGVMSQKTNPSAWNVMCQSGATYMHITSTGIVTPCTWMAVEAGDIRKKKLADIWKHSPAFQLIRGRGSYDKCIAHSFVESGDPLAQDPLKWG